MQHAFIRKDRLPKLQNKYMLLPQIKGQYQRQFQSEGKREPKISKSSSIARIRGAPQQEDKLRSYNSTPLLSIQQSSSFSRNLSNAHMYRPQSIQRIELERPSSRKAEKLSKSLEYANEKRKINQDSQSIFEDSEWSSVKDTTRFDNKMTPGFLERCDSFSFGESEKPSVNERFEADLNLVSLKIPNPYGIKGRLTEVQEWKKN